MLKALFWILLLVNGGLFAYQQGYLASLFPDGREPARMAKQISPASVQIVPLPAAAAPAPAAGQEPASATAATNVAATGTVNVAANGTVATQAAAVPGAAAANAPAVLAAAEKKPEPLACTEIGNFDTAEAGRFEQRLASVKLGDSMKRRNVQETARNMVYIPPQGSKEGADKKAGELKRLGVNDFFIIQEGEQRWGISLGVFRSEEAARGHLADLNKKGVHSARLGLFPVSASRTAFQFRGIDAATLAAVTKVKGEFTRQEIRACE